LNRIDAVKQEMNLVRYKLNNANVTALTGVVNQIVPSKLLKLAFIDNNLKDEEMAEFVKALSNLEERGITSLVYA
jgi:hypothetical protein